MNKQRLRKQLDRAWAEFTMSFAGLSDAHMTQPGVAGEWSVKDILAHVTWWEEEALKHLPVILQGGTPPRYSVTYGGVDAFNALMFEQRHGLPLAEVMRQLDDTHAKLVAYVHSAPEAEPKHEARFRRRLKLDAYGHYPLHTRMIREWRERVSL